MSSHRTREDYTGSAAIPLLLTALLAAGVWSLFHPALMSYDSVVQYGQAISGRLTSWHPPLMAIALRAVLAVGGTLGMLMAAQCLAGALGVWAFSGSCLEALFGERLTPARRAWISFGVLLVLLLPASPLVFYLMTFWKDAWALVLLLWLGALALRLASRPEAGAGLTTAVVLLGALLGMVRHNAIVALPFLGLFLWIELRRRGMRWAPVLVAAPLAACLLLNALVDRAFAVKDESPEDWVLSLDLAGVCAASAATCEQLPYTRSHVRDLAGLKARYRPGDLGSVFWEEPRLVDSSMVTRAHRPEIRAEYLRVLRDDPDLLLRLKLEAFWDLLGTRRTFYFFHDQVADNPYGLYLHEWSSGARAWLSRTVREAGESSWRWLWGVHLVWLIATVLWIAGLFARRRPRVALFLLVPLGYAFSYVPATPVPDFRFLYPASLLVQCLTVAALLGALLRQKPSGRVPNLASVSE
jgi:hypothetical protein